MFVNIISDIACPNYYDYLLKLFYFQYCYQCYYYYYYRHCFHPVM